MDKEASIAADRPIEAAADDKLGRAKSAKSFVRQFLRFDASHGLVAGVFGSWGMGKTSFLNMVRELLKKEQEEVKEKDLIIIDFNPWLFSGSEKIIENFLSEISDALADFGGSYKRFGRELSTYGKKIKEIPEGIKKLHPWVHFFADLFGVLSSVGAAREQVIEDANKTLRGQNKKIVVMIDDVDRLSNDEVRDIFKVIRLIANLPNVIYIVACDYIHVTQALSEAGFSGESYLEKIVQIHYNLPEASRNELDAIFNDVVLSGFIQPSKMNTKERRRLSEVYDKIISPLILNVRDIYRYRATLWESIATLEERVCLVDIAALEAIRLFLPHIFDIILNNTYAFSVGYDPEYYDIETGAFQNEPKTGIPKNCISTLDKGLTEKDRGRGHGRIVRGIAECLFPSFSKSQPKYESYFKNASWEIEQFRERRVSHKSILHYYLTRTENADIRYARLAKNLSQRMHDENEARAYLAKFEPAKWPEIVLRLRYYEDMYTQIGGRGLVQPSIVFLWNLLSEASDHSFVVERRLFGNIRKMTLMMLDVIPEDLVPSGHFLVDPLESIPSFSTRIQLTELIRKHKPIASTIMRKVEEKLYSEILNDPTGEFIALEWAAPEIILFAKRVARSKETSFNIPRTLALALTVHKRAQLAGRNTNEYFHEIFDEDDSSREVSREMRLLLPGNYS